MAAPGTPSVFASVEQGGATYLFVGAGGIGASVAARLSPHAPVMVVDGWLKHVTAIREHGLTLSLPEGDAVAAVPAYGFDSLKGGGPLPDVDAAFISVKSYDTGAVLQWLLPLLEPTVPLVSLQNGLNEQLIAAAAGADRTVGAVVMFDAVIVEPGHVMTRHPEAPLTIGAWPAGPRKNSAQLAELLARALPVVTSEDIRSDLWGKLIVNCMLNAPAAASGFGLRDLMATDAGPLACAEVAREAAAVAAASGAEVSRSWLYGLSPGELLGDQGVSQLARTLRVTFATSDMRPSMLTDVERGRHTEIDSLNGVVVGEARRLGIEAPWNEHFVEIVSRIGRRTARPSEGWLSR